VDVAVRLPGGLLQARDFLDNRYFLKRGLYLHALRRALAADAGARGVLHRELGCAEPAGAIVFWPWRDPRKPCLELRCRPPGLPGGAALRLVLRPSIAANNFPAAKLRPDRCNLKAAPCPPWGSLPDWQVGGGGPGPAAPAGGGGAGEGGGPTPHYTHAILEDTLLEVHADYLSACAAGVGGRLLGGAAALLKVWARTQFVGAAAGGPGGFELTALAADTLLAHPLLAGAPGASPLDVARCTLQRLASPAFAEGGRMQVSEAGSEDPAARLQLLEGFRRQFPGGFVLIDPSGHANLLARARPAALRRLADAAGRASRSLAAVLRPGGELAGGGPALHSAFDALLLRSLRFGSAFDFTFQVQLTARGATAAGEGGGEGESAAAGGPAYAADRPRAELEELRVEETVRLALGRRAAFVCALPRGAAGPAAAGGVVRVGVVVDPEHLAAPTDVGPDGTERERGRLFRRFWGDLAELRRFRDGRIAEAVAWDVPQAERSLGCLVPRAAGAALERHFPGAIVTCLSAPLLAAGRSGGGVEAQGVLWDGLAAEAALGRACEELGQLLRRLESLPLRVAGFRGLDAALRRTEPFPPAVHPLATGTFEAQPRGAGAGRAGRPPLCPRPVHVRASLEGSGRWPRDPAAFAKTRAAFQLRLAAVLQADFGLKAVATEDFLEVFFRGFVFRLELETLEEAPGTARAGAGAGVGAGAGGLGSGSRKRPRGIGDDDEDGEGEEGEEDRGVEGGAPLPGAVHDALAALGAREPSFQGAAKLAKLWVGAHMLGGAVPDAAAEVACAAAYVGDGEAGRRGPASSCAGFLRFLQVVAEHPWAHRPLLVPLGSAPVAAAAGGDLDASAIVAEAGGGDAGGAGGEGGGRVARREALDAFDRGGRPMGLAVLEVGGAGAPALFVADGVSALSLRRLQLAAGHALGLLLRAGEGGAPAAGGDKAGELVARAFTPSAEGFDAILRLHPGAVPDRACEGACFSKGGGSTSAPKVFSGRVIREALRDPAAAAPAVKLGRVPRAVLEGHSLEFAQDALLVGLDPGAAFAAELRARFGALAEFFRNPRGGTAVGVCWRPGAFQVADEEVGGASGGTAGLPRVSWADAASGRRRSVVDAAAVLADMAALGAGLAGAPGLCESARAVPPAALRL